jgi:nucleoside 2-deoxyribosyltransferase
MKAYLANGLFSMGDRLVNEKIASEIRKTFPDIDLYVPQENEGINDKSKFADSKTIAKADSKALLESDFLIAVIDGVEIDSGVAAEIGMFSMTEKPIYSLFTDIRQEGRNNLLKLNALVSDPTENQFVYRNLFVIGLIKQSGGGIFSTIQEMVNKIKGDFQE